MKFRNAELIDTIPAVSKVHNKHHDFKSSLSRK